MPELVKINQSKNQYSFHLPWYYNSSTLLHKFGLKKTLITLYCKLTLGVVYYIMFIDT